jgi:hypothetical protein
MFPSYSQERCLEQLVKDKGHTPCHSCESQRVGVDEYASDWASGGSLQVVTKCSDCEAGGRASSSLPRKRRTAASNRTKPRPSTRPFSHRRSCATTSLRVCSLGLRDWHREARVRDEGPGIGLARPGPSLCFPLFPTSLYIVVWRTAVKTFSQFGATTSSLST